MAPVPNPKVVFSAVPNGYPVVGKDITYDKTPTIDLDSVALDGGVLVKTLYLSVDPYMRGRMREGQWKVGMTWEGLGIGEVLRSESDKYKKGDNVYGFYKFQAYNIFPAFADLRVIENPEGLPLSVYIGVAGMPGKTAFYGLKAIADPKPGEKIFVSTAAGPVGQLVSQLAQAWGLKVIGSTGSDEKVKFLKEELKLDAAFNYKTSSTAEELKKFGGIDIYWDNVGGETLDAALAALHKFGRIVVCGHITMYNIENPQDRYGIKNTWEMIYKELKMVGLMVTTYEEQYGDEFYATVPKLIAEGKIKYLEDVTEGLENAGEAFLRVLKGDNHGKAVVKVA